MVKCIPMCYCRELHYEIRITEVHRELHNYCIRVIIIHDQILFIVLLVIVNTSGIVHCSIVHYSERHLCLTRIQC